MRTSKLGMRLLSILFGVALIVSGCSTANSANSSSSSKGVQSFSGTIKIGTTIWNLPAVDLNVRYPGIKAAVRAINESGGINGKKLVWDDCEAADPNGLEACARKMISDGVVATVGDSIFIDELPFNQILAQAGIPQIDPFITAPQSYVNPNIYLIAGGLPPQYGAVPAFMKLKHIKTFHFVEGVSPQADEIMSVTRQAARYYHVQEQGSPTAVSITAADYTPYVAGAATAGAGVNILTIAPFMTTLFLQAGEQLGQKLPLGLDSEFTAAQLKQYGQPGGFLAGAMLTDAVPPLSLANEYPGLKLYLHDLEAEYKAGDAMADPNTVNPLSTLSWLDVEVLSNVMKGLKTVTPATVKHAFNTVKDLNTFGLTPPWTPSAQGPSGFTRVSNPWTYLITVKDGQAVLFQQKLINAMLPFQK